MEKSVKETEKWIEQIKMELIDFLIKDYQLEKIDIGKERDLILEKKSNLSKSQRYAVLFIYKKQMQ